MPSQLAALRFAVLPLLRQLCQHSRTKSHYARAGIYKDGGKYVQRAPSPQQRDDSSFGPTSFQCHSSLPNVKLFKM